MAKNYLTCVKQAQNEQRKSVCSNSTKPQRITISKSFSIFLLTSFVAIFVYIINFCLYSQSPQNHQIFHTFYRIHQILPIEVQSTNIRLTFSASIKKPCRSTHVLDSTKLTGPNRFRQPGKKLKVNGKTVLLINHASLPPSLLFGFFNLCVANDRLKPGTGQAGVPGKGFLEFLWMRKGRATIM